MRRWLTCAKNGIPKSDRQHLIMSFVRKLVYAPTERMLNEITYKLTPFHQSVQICFTCKNVLGTGCVIETIPL